MQTHKTANEMGNSELDKLLGGRLFWHSTFTHAQMGVIWGNAAGEVFVSILVSTGNAVSVEGTVKLANKPFLKPNWIGRNGF